MKLRLALLGLLFILPQISAAVVTVNDDARFVEIELDWSQIAPEVTETAGSTHELTFDRNGGGTDVWITGQNYDGLAKISLDGSIKYFRMPRGSGPHGILYDNDGQLWVSLEFDGMIAKINENGRIKQKIDIRMNVKGRSKPVNPAPHGIALGPDGCSIWFTGKRTSTVGKIGCLGGIRHFEIETLASLPIYLHAGPKNRIWGTELLGNKIFSLKKNGKVREYPIPGRNSRPIAITQGPDGQMWFSQEAGRKVARIDRRGNITEFEIPITQENMILAGMTFDNEGNLWTHGYIDANDPTPEGDDYLFKVDREILYSEDGDMSAIDVTLYRVPSRNTIMHRIMQGPDGNIWFTELGNDQVGVLIIED